MANGHCDYSKIEPFSLFFRFLLRTIISLNLSRSQSAYQTDFWKVPPNDIKKAYKKMFLHLYFFLSSLCICRIFCFIIGSIDTRKYAFVEAWFKRCQLQIPNYQKVCGHGAEIFGDWYRSSKAANNRN